MNKKFAFAIRRKIGKYILILRNNDIWDLLYIYIENIILRKKLLWFNNDSVEAYCNLFNEKLLNVEPQSERLVYVPPYFELQGEQILYYSSPAIFVAVLNDVSIIGGTGAVLTGKKILLDELKYDVEQRLLLRFGPIKKTKKDRVLVALDKKKIKIENAINLCGVASANYYHFTMEILSRLDYIKGIEEMDEWPILIDSDVKKYSQFVELLNVIKDKHNVIYIDANKQVEVNKLVQISMNTWMPFNVKNRDMFKISDSLIAKSGIENIRKHTEKYMKPQSKKKIYLSRKNTKLSRIRNEEKIIPFFKEVGFEIVYTENLSYIEQIELFSSAKCVVGATGAALTNLIYCHPDTVVGCLIPESYKFAIYSTIAYHIGAKILFLDVEIVSKHTYMAGDICKADEEQCKRYIQALLGMCSED